MKKNDLSVFEIEKEGLRLKLQRGRPEQTTTSTSTETASLPKIAIVPAETGKPADTSSLKDIVSPMVGTFYRAGSPDGAPRSEERRAGEEKRCGLAADELEQQRVVE